MTKFIRILKSGFSNFVRNGWLSVASITIMVLTLITMSMFLVVNVVLNTGIKSIQDKIDISVYFNDDAKQGDIIALQEDLADLEEVKTIKFVSKDEALKRYEEQNKDNPKLLESLKDTENPLPPSLEIKVYDPSKLDVLTPIFDNEKYKLIIHKVSYKENKTIIDKLFQATQFTKQVGVIATLAFTVTALVIIFNTVKMAIFTRKEEIDIMKLVGATPSFIKGPFLIEGAIYGVISTLISIMIIGTILYFLAPTLVHYFGGVGDDLSGFIRSNIVWLVFAQLFVGIFIGTVSSWLAVRKYVKIS
ncbi:MAG: permease-like cell division protein FtsX [Patescibacteria group bacterium]|nr:permease-like cell division protein FtsX [Patescibacteria group bacterium]